MNIDEIIKEIKEGKSFTIACSNYEQYFWFKDDAFYTSIENGYCEGAPSKKDEAYVRRNISIALHHPEEWDAMFE